MTAGDVVNGIAPGGGGLDYQPAAGVEAMITLCFCGPNFPVLYDGTNTALPQYRIMTTAVDTPEGRGVYGPILVNNTRYLRIPVGSVVNAYCGVQTK